MSELEINGNLICKNCGITVSGNFCNNCGQRIRVHKESFGELLREFFSDFTHFDSKLVKCIIPLLFKPARLTKQYIEGKRQSQFNPIRLYLFSSFIYFLIAFSGNEKHETQLSNTNNVPQDSILNSIKQEIKDTVNNRNYASEIKDTLKINKSDSLSNVIVHGNLDNLEVNLNYSGWIDSLIENEVTKVQYERNQSTLPSSKQDGFFRSYLTKKVLLLAEESRRDGKGLLSKINDAATHNIPKMLFFLLPIFALLLKILYLRRKEFYYFDHAVLSLHYFSFIFVLLTIMSLPDKFLHTDLITFAIIYALIYLFFAMKYLYGQSFFKTFLKYSMLVLMFCFSLALAFAITFLVSAALTV